MDRVTVDGMIVRGAEVCTPGAAPSKAECIGVYVGTAGDLNVDFKNGGGSGVVIANAAVGYHLIDISEVNASGTTADDILYIFGDN